MLLPTEDLENECLRLLVAEIFAEMMLGAGISGKACEGWVLWEGITRIAEVVAADHPGDKASQEVKSEQSLSRLEQFGLLSASGEEVTAPVTADSSKGGSPLAQRHGGMSSSSLARAFWLMVQCAFLAASAARAVIVALAGVRSLPPRFPAGVSADEQEQQEQKHRRWGASAGVRKRAMVSMRAWSAGARVLGLGRRMPWLWGLLALGQRAVGSGRMGKVEGELDR